MNTSNITLYVIHPSRDLPSLSSGEWVHLSRNIHAGHLPIQLALSECEFAASSESLVKVRIKNANTSPT